MNKKVLLISEAQIKQESIIEKNVDSKLLSKVIINTQELSLKTILGCELYDTIIDAVDLLVSSGTSLSNAHSTLLTDYIQPYLMYVTLADFIVINNYKISNKGVLKMQDSQASNISPDELESVKNYIDNYAGKYKKNLVDYIKDNDLLNSSCACSVTNNVTAEAVGWFIQSKY